MLTKLSQPVATYFDTSNHPDKVAFVSNFSDDAVLVDDGREYKGIAEIQEWSNVNVFAAELKYEITKVVLNIERSDETIVTAKVDGTFDKTGLPDPLLFDHHFTVEKGEIVRLSIRFLG